MSTPEVRSGPPCPHCGKPRKQVNEYIPATCGNSACQQDEYRANGERVAARRRRRTR